MYPFPQDSPFEYRTLVEKLAYIKRNAIISLVLSILSLFICGFLGIFAFSVASSVIETSDYYQIGRDYRGIGVGAKIISIIAIVLWVIGIVIRVFFWSAPPRVR
jgi:hypothetical protein